MRQTIVNSDWLIKYMQKLKEEEPKNNSEILIALNMFWKRAVEICEESQI